MLEKQKKNQKKPQKKTNNYADYLSEIEEENNNNEDDNLNNFLSQNDLHSSVEFEIGQILDQIKNKQPIDENEDEKTFLLTQNNENTEKEEKEPSKLTVKLENFKYSIFFHFDQLLAHYATAKDYYVAYATIEVICWFYMILFQPAFTYDPSDTYTFFLLESRIPKSFFWIILIQFILIVIDRVIYLFRSTTSKVAMQYFTLIYYFILLFMILPEGSGEPFLQKPFLVFFFLLKCFYWWLSALQISDGFPINIQSRFLTKSYSQVRFVFSYFFLLFNYIYYFIFY